MCKRLLYFVAACILTSNAENFAPFQLFYKADNGELYGPYPVQQLSDWYSQGYFNPNTLVSSQSAGPFVPIDSYLSSYHIPISNRYNEFEGEGCESNGINGPDDCEDDSSFGMQNPYEYGQRSTSVSEDDYNAEEYGYNDEIGFDDELVGDAYNDGFDLDSSYNTQQKPKESRRKSFFGRIREKVLRKIKSRPRGDRNVHESRGRRDRQNMPEGLGPYGGGVSEPFDSEDDEDELPVNQVSFPPVQPMHQHTQVESRAGELSSYTGPPTTPPQSLDRPNNAAHRVHMVEDEEDVIQFEAFQRENADSVYTGVSSKALTGKVSVHSIGVSLEELWGNDNKFGGSLLPFDVSLGMPHRKNLNVFSSLAGNLEAVGKRTIWRPLIQTYQLAPARIWMMVSIIFIRAAVFLPIIGVVCYIIELIMLQSFENMSVMALENHDADQLLAGLLKRSPVIIKDFIFKLNAVSPLAHDVLSSFVKGVIAYYSALKPVLLFLSAISVFLLILSVVQPYLLKSTVRTLQRRGETGDLSVDQPLLTESLCTLLGSFLFVSALAAWSYRAGYTHLGKAFIAVLALGLIETNLIRSNWNWIDLPENKEEAILLKDYRRHVDHLNDNLGNEESRAYLEEWSLVDAAESLKESLSSSMHEVRQKLLRRMPRKKFGLVRKWLGLNCLLVWSLTALLRYSDTEDPVYRGVQHQAHSVLGLIKYLYFRFGVELTTADDASAFRRIQSVALLATVFLPVCLLLEIVNSCSRVNNILALVSSDLTLSVDEVRSSNVMRRSGWTSGDIRSAGILLERFAVSTQGSYKVNELSLHIRAGEITGIVGDRRSGKEELVAAIAGCCKLQTHGTLSLLGRSLADWDSSYIKAKILLLRRNERKIGLLAGDIAGLFLVQGEAGQRARRASGAVPVLSALTFGAQSLLDADSTSNIAEGMDGHDWSTLSLCRALNVACVTKDIIILEDPSATMTEDEEDELFKYLHMLKSSGKAIIVYASRPPRPLLVDRVITMEGGSLREDKTFLNDKIMRHD